jgi:hypothetical protein
MQFARSNLLPFVITRIADCFGVIEIAQSQDAKFSPSKYKLSLVENLLKGLVPYARPVPGRSLLKKRVSSCPDLLLSR